MNKKLKINLIIIIAIEIIIILTNNVFAAKSLVEIANQTQIDNSLANTSAPFGNRAYVVVKVVGIFSAVIVLMVVGIKYMIGSSEEKAEYKQTAFIYIAGAVLLFATPFIIDYIHELLN